MTGGLFGDDDSLQVRKVAAFLPISDELLADALGELREDAGPIPRPPLLRRLGWRWQDARERLGELVAGRRFCDCGGDDR